MNNTKKIVISSLFAALIFITTAYLFHIPTGLSGGYIHIGDFLIYLAASLLPPPYSIFAAAIGAGLADVLSGAIIWVIPTVIIKSLMSVFFTSSTNKIITKRNIIAVFIGVILTIGGYYLAGAILTGNFAAPLAEVPFNLLQAAGNAVIYVVFGIILDKADFKRKLI